MGSRKRKSTGADTSAVVKRLHNIVAKRTKKENASVFLSSNARQLYNKKAYIQGQLDKLQTLISSNYQKRRRLKLEIEELSVTERSLEESIRMTRRLNITTFYGEFCIAEQVLLRTQAVWFGTTTYHDMRMVCKCMRNALQHPYIGIPRITTDRHPQRNHLMIGDIVTSLPMNVVGRPVTSIFGAATWKCFKQYELMVKWARQPIRLLQIVRVDKYNYQKWSVRPLVPEDMWDAICDTIESTDSWYSHRTRWKFSRYSRHSLWRICGSDGRKKAIEKYMPSFTSSEVQTLLSKDSGLLTSKTSDSSISDESVGPSFETI
jgi:hypothetical protein